MKILHLSDTHGYHRRLHDLPQADIVVHSGDFCMAGVEREAFDFLNWFCDLPYKHKIFICGNHDDCLYEAGIDGLDDNVHYLYNSGVELEGLKFFGVPLFVEDCMTERQDKNYDLIQDDTDVLITHSPAYGILDKDGDVNYGSKVLRAKLDHLHLKAHLFGHIHVSHGMETINGTIFSNGAIMRSDYTHVLTCNVITI